MAKSHHPRRGSMQFWPRSRANKKRIRSWATEKSAKPLGFIGYKAGMAQVLATDNRAKSITKGETVALPVTIVECPPLTVLGATFYTKSMHGVRKSATVMTAKPAKEIARLGKLPKKTSKTFDDIKEFDDMRLLVHTNPKRASSGAKKPEILEVALGGSNEEKLAFAKEHLGKEISAADLFEEGSVVDIHGITKGKGFQGTVKRFGVPIKQHKGEKIKRGIGNLGAWTPKRVDFRTPQSGKMGYHLRTEYNKQILKMGSDGKDVTPKSGLNRYGIVKNPYILLKGSIPGPAKRSVVICSAIRQNKKVAKDGFTITKVLV